MNVRFRNLNCRSDENLQAGISEPEDGMKQNMKRTEYSKDISAEKRYIFTVFFILSKGRVRLKSFTWSLRL